MAQSRNTALVLVALAASAALGTVVWLALDDGAASAEVVGPAAMVATRGTPSSNSKLVAPQEDADERAVESTAERAAPTATSSSASERAAVGVAAERELAEALWVEGRVEWPEGVPLDEELDVVADGKEFQHVGEPKGKHRVRVGRDGRFRVAFRKDTLSGSLSIGARYCFLETPLKLKPASPPENIVLAPELGGCIAGVITPPPGAQDLDAVRARATVMSVGWGMKRDQQQRKAKPDASWRYELRGLAADLEHHVQFESQVWMPFDKSSVRVAAGQVTIIDIVCERGVTLRGVIVDDAGEPVGNTSVIARASDQTPARPAFRHGQSNAKGEFSLQGAPYGAVELEFSREGFLDKKVELEKLADGEAREQLRVTLDSGRFVTGVVTWDDGAPAERAMVQVEGPSEGQRFVYGEPKGHRVDAQGRFKITGLGEGPFKVTASAPEASRPRPAGIEAPKSKNSGPKWRADARGVTPGAEVVLVLGPGASVAGIVVDESGAPVEKFMIRTAQRSGESVFVGPAGVAARKFDAPDGRFVLEGLSDGAWDLFAQAKGFSDSESAPIDVPYSGPELRITLSRAARLAGIVVDPSGKPLADVKLEIQRDREHVRRFGFGGEDARRTDKQGRFELRDTPSGLVTLYATHPKFAASPRVELRLAPGEERDDLRLELSEGGSVRGSIHADEFRHSDQWSVNISSKEGDWSHTTVDADGKFSFELVHPGKHTVYANGHGNEPSEGKRGPRRALSATVTVEAGKTTEVVLGGPGAQPIELRGRVTIAGSPAAGATLYVSRSGFTRQVESGADGTYSVMVDGSGKYTVNTNLRDNGASQASYVDILDGGPTVHDVEFLDGQLRGRVVTASGDPVANVSVQLALVRASTETQRGARHASVRTDAKGAFELRGVTPGEHQLTVIDMFSLDSPRFGPVVLESVLVAGDRASEELLLQVEPGGALRCVIRGVDGGAAIGASVLVRSTDGSVWGHMFVNRNTDGAGLCTLSGLATGDYIVVARLEDAVGMSSAVRAKSGESRDVQVSLRRGGSLEITRTADEGVSFKSKLVVLDATGFDWALGATSWSTAGAATRLGPLPPGAYRVRSTGSNDEVAEVAATLRAGDTQAVTLHLTAQ